MYELGKSLGVDQILIKQVIGLAPELRLPAEAMPQLRQELLAMLEEDCQPGRCHLRFDLLLDKELHYFVTGEQLRQLPPGVRIYPDCSHPEPRINYCFMGWHAALIAANGSVFPCCSLMELPGKELGNVLQRSLAEIWQGADYSRFRAEVQRLMLLRGKMAQSRRFLRFIESICIDCYACPFSFNLASPEFYAEVARRVDARTSTTQRLLAQGRNRFVKSSQLLLARLRKFGRPAAK
jgi:radical SAM protein with 4Fe4S-binding SPASM domain